MTLPQELQTPLSARMVPSSQSSRAKLNKDTAAKLFGLGWVLGRVLGLGHWHNENVVVTPTCDEWCALPYLAVIGLQAVYEALKAVNRPVAESRVGTGPTSYCRAEATVQCLRSSYL
jgi:hypothetical protein